jgi:ABC-type multidrug transport system ATPase subunit
MEEIVLKTIKLKKHFWRVKAVEEVSLEVRRGSIYGFLGPNGAGKTTTIGMILSLVRPSAGSITLFGKPVTIGNNFPLRRVGALMGLPSILPYMSARENLCLVRQLYPDISKKRVDEVLEIIGLEKVANRKSGNYSTGMKQRLGLGIAIFHKPELLILDEPTNGMDPAGMHEIRNLLRKLADNGMTIFLSSHLLHEVEQICDYVAILKKGRIVAQGKMDALLGKEKRAVRVRVPSPSDAAALLMAQPGVREVAINGKVVMVKMDAFSGKERGTVQVHIPSPSDAVALLLAKPGVSEAVVDGPYVTIQGIPSEAVIAHLVKNGIVPSEVTISRPDLEQLFLEVTGSDIS